MTMLCPSLVGREAELERVDQRLAAARRGDGAAVAVVGEAGVGKSRLVRELASRARMSGSAVLVGRSTEAPAPFRPLVEVLLAAERVGLDREHPSLRDVTAGLSIVPGWRDRRLAADGPPASELLVGEAALRCLRLLSRDVVVIIEDLHWADGATLEAVSYLVDHIRGERLALVVSTRPTAGFDATKRSYEPLLELAPLAPSEVARMVEACLGALPPHRLVDEVVFRTGGNSFLVEEMLAGLVTDGSLTRRDYGWRFDPSKDPTAPFTVVASVAERLEKVGTQCRDVLRQAAVLGREIRIPVVANATSLDEDDVVGMLRAGAQAQLLSLDRGGFQFRHVLTLDAVVQATPPAARQRYARQGLDALLACDDAGDVATLRAAAHLARVVGDGALAAELSINVAETELARTHTATAEAAVREALLSAPPDTPVEARAKRLLFETLATAGLTGEALDLGEALLAAGSDEDVGLRLQLARVAALARRDDKAVELLRNVEGIEDADGHQVAESRIIQALVALQRGDADGARDLAAAPTVSTVLDPALRCEALNILGRADRNVDTASAAKIFHQQLDVARVHGLVLWAARALHELGTIDLVTTLNPSRLVEARGAAVEARAPALVATVDLQLAALHVERMELDDAVSAARRCRDVAQSLRLPLSRYAWALEAAAHARAGRRDDMAAAARRGREEAGDDPEVAAVIEGYAEAVLGVVEWDVARSLLHFDRAAQAAEALGTVPMPFRGLHALVAAVTEGVDAIPALDAARRQHGGSGASDATLALAEAALMGAADKDQAEDRLAVFEVSMAARRSGDWLGHVCRLVAAGHALENGWGDPLKWLRGGLAEFERRRQPHLAERCRQLLRQVGAPVPRRRTAFDVPPALARVGVTGREAEILALVARGASNREIAGELVLSPRTVEKHVENLTMKTGTRRDALGALAESIGMHTGGLRPASP